MLMNPKNPKFPMFLNFLNYHVFLMSQKYH